MKKIIAAVFAIIFCFALVACKSDVEVSHSGYKKCSQIAFSSTTTYANIKVLRIAKYDGKNGTIYCAFNAYSSDESSVFDKDKISDGAKNLPSSVSNPNSGAEYAYSGVLGYIIEKRTVVEYSEKKKRAIITYDEYLNIDVDKDDFKKIEGREIYIVSNYEDGRTNNVYAYYTCETKRTETHCDLSNAPFVSYRFEDSSKK